MEGATQEALGGDTALRVSASESETQAILRGDVTILDPALAAAFREGLRAASSQSTAIAVRPELNASSFSSLVASPHPAVRAAAIHALNALLENEDGQRVVDDAVASGLLGALMKSIRDVYESSALPNKDDATRELAETLTKVCLRYSKSDAKLTAVLPDSYGVDEEQVRPLAQTLGRLMSALGSNDKPDAASQLHGTAVAVLEAFLEVVSLTSTWEAVDEAADTVLKESSVMSGIMSLIRTDSKVEREATDAARLLAWCADVPQWCDEFSSIDGFSRVIDMIASTAYAPEITTELLNCCSNACTHEDADATAEALVRAGALDFLQPAVLSPVFSVALEAALLIIILALHPKFSGLVQGTEAFTVIEDVFRSFAPGSTGDEGKITFGPTDVPTHVRLTAPDAPAVFQLVALHDMLRADVKKYPAGKSYFLQPKILEGIRACAASADAFVYSAAVQLLRSIDQPVPVYRNTPREDRNKAEKGAPPLWSIDDVCSWVGQQAFAQYRQQFRESLVNGKVLLALNEEMLTAVGVSHPVHRCAIMFAIDELRQQVAAPSASQSPAHPTDALLPLSPTPGGRQQYRYDVFISYRRAGGADFAQLLKIQLRAAGLEVFLDVENLGTGDFSEQLVSSLLASRNVVLVWTRGCMDRFLDDADPATVDFVRMEYVQTLRLRKNAIPVYKEDFVFPTEERLPADVRGVLRLNAVKWSAEYREASFAKLRAALVL
jgi:hypothetical protein